MTQVTIVIYKDTDDVVKEDVVSETALFPDLVQAVSKQVFISWPIVLQKDDHVTKRHVVSRIRLEGFFLTERKGDISDAPSRKHERNM